MGKYSDGTISITGGSDLVTGQGTKFKAYVSAGSALLIWGLSTPFTIIEVIDDTTLRIDAKIAGVNTLYSLSYAISDHFTPALDMPLLAPDSINTQVQMVRALETLDREIPTTLKPPTAPNF